MTLFRKGLINWYSHGLWYTACLILSMFHIFHMIPGYVFPIKVLLAFGCRVQFRANKYLIWTAFVLLSFPAAEEAIVQFVTQFATAFAGFASNLTMAMIELVTGVVSPSAMLSTMLGSFPSLVPSLTPPSMAMFKGFNFNFKTDYFSEMQLPQFEMPKMPQMPESLMALSEIPTLNMDLLNDITSYYDYYLAKPFTTFAGEYSSRWLQISAGTKHNRKPKTQKFNTNKNTQHANTKTQKTNKTIPGAFVALLCINNLEVFRANNGTPQPSTATATGSNETSASAPSKSASSMGAMKAPVLKSKAPVLKSGFKSEEQSILA